LTDRRKSIKVTKSSVSWAQGRCNAGKQNLLTKAQSHGLPTFPNLEPGMVVFNRKVAAREIKPGGFMR